MHWSADDTHANMNTSQQIQPQDSSLEVPSLGPIKNVEFPPLSQQPVAAGETMPPSNPVDQIVLEKSTPIEPGQLDETTVEKNIPMALNETEAIIHYGLRYVRHLNAMSMELQLMLEFEQKILEQVMTRIDKFKALRDENKRKSTEWENDYKAKTPEYEEFSTKLINVPHVDHLPEAGVPPPVHQKILFQIVSRSTNTANRVVVQLSMEEAVANDIDLTLQDLKKHCAVMLRQINGWLKTIKTLVCHQSIVIDRWDEAKNIIKGMKSKGDAVSMIGSEMGAFNCKKYEERLRVIEEAICKLCGPECGTCPKVQAPSTTKSSQKQNLCHPPSHVPVPGARSPPGPAGQGTMSEFPYENPENFPGQPYIMSSAIRPPMPGQSQGTAPGTTRSNLEPLRGTQQLDPYNQRLKQIEDAVRKMCNEVLPRNDPGSQLRGDYADQWDPIRAGPDSPRSPGGVTPQSPGVFATPRSDGFIEDPYVPPECEPEPVDGAEGLRRNRAPPGMFPDIDLVDAPGMGFPVPRVALERGGRPRGQTVPLSPTSPQPRQMGRFRPLAVSSPAQGDTSVLRPRQPPTPLPPNPMAGQQLDPALLPKIQEDLQRLAERNKKLQDLVNNFKCLRATLTDEIDKAVRLNQKLQRDLYYVAEAQGQ